MSVYFPWGSLLSALFLPTITVLQGIRQICAEEAILEIILGYGWAAEPNETQRLELPVLTPEHLSGHLRQAYERAGFRDFRWQVMNKEQLEAISTTWAKRLAFGKERIFYRMTARAIVPS